MPTAPDKDIATLGQVFTPPEIVRAMLALRQNQGRILEPSCGDGAFVHPLRAAGETVVAIEPDPRHAPAGALPLDFFAYPESETFPTVIGNPPYVRFQDIAPTTRALLPIHRFDRRTNLYLFFIEKAVRHLTPDGELIFITPRDFLKTTASVRLNRWLLEHGSLTHVIDLGDANIFAHAVPNCLIWRYQRGHTQRTLRYATIRSNRHWREDLQTLCWQTRTLTEHNGHLAFIAQNDGGLLLKDIAGVRVGGVSGADALYTSDTHGNRDFVCSHTRTTGQTRRMIWPDPDRPPEILLPHKAQLLARKVQTFTEANWWHWGRSYPQTDAPRIYVNGRTRHPQPFFLHPCPHFDGAILALFPHRQDTDLAALCAALNAHDWQQAGFLCNGRHLFTQRSLENAPLPEAFRRFAPQ